MENQEKNKEEITTIPDLVVLIKNSFQSAKEHVDERFDKVEDRLDKVENRLDKVENRLGKVEGKIDSFVERYDEAKLEMRVDYVENILNVPKK